MKHCALYVLWMVLESGGRKSWHYWLCDVQGWRKCERLSAWNGGYVLWLVMWSIGREEHNSRRYTVRWMHNMVEASNIDSKPIGQTKYIECKCVG